MNENGKMRQTLEDGKRNILCDINHWININQKLYYNINKNVMHYQLNFQNIDVVNICPKRSTVSVGAN